MRTTILYFLSIALLVIGGCKKKDDPVPVTPPAPSNPPAAAPAGTLTVDWLTGSASGPPLNRISATAIFLSSGTGVNVGAVSVNSFTLQWAGSASSYSNNNIDPTSSGLATSPLIWTIAGDNGFEALTHEVDDLPIPILEDIISSEVVVRAAGYTFYTTPVSGADSVTFDLNGVKKILSGNATSCTFTPQELAGLSTGFTYMKVTATKYRTETIQDKEFQFQRSRSRSAIAEVF